MTKVTFPHMGTLAIPMKSLLLNLGLQPVVPPPTSQSTIAIGTKLAPEFACLPLKVNLGNYVEAITHGAELILMAGGVGPCRFGYYAQVQREALRDAGFDVQLVTLEAPNADPGELFRQIKKFIPRHSPTSLFNAFHVFWKKARAIDVFDRVVNQIRAREESPGEATLVQNRFYNAINCAEGLKDIRNVLKTFIKELQSISHDPERQSLKIMLLGEIYMVLEPKINFRIEETLGQMGVEVKRSIYLSDWIEEHLNIFPIAKKSRSHLLQLAHPYLDSHVGGHGLESVAHGIEAGVNRMDGIIQLAPFTCMPEIIAMPILSTISNDFAIPVLHLIIDEHSGEAGIHTRLEAFIDLLKHRKSNLIQERQSIL
jgi:predicted nucleotide-binding protein (sugar kinase/HSP70/actin superfamily)